MVEFSVMEFYHNTEWSGRLWKEVRRCVMGSVQWKSVKIW